MSVLAQWLRTVELKPDEILPSEECQSELKVNKSETTHAAVVPAGIGELMNCENYSSFTRLTARVLKFCQLTRPHSSTPAESDMTKAEILWVLEAQKGLVKDPKFKQ